MAKATVRIYDGDGNIVDELPYGTNGITGSNGTGKPQEVYSSKNDNGEVSYYAPGYRSSASDPFENASQSIEEYVNAQAPKVTVENGTVTLNAPDNILDAPISQQIIDELQTLKGSNLESQEVKDAIEALNEEIRNTIKSSVVEGTLGWTKEGYADYQRLLQAIRQANPMSSTDIFIAKRPGGDFYYEDEEGRQIMKKTLKEWIDYWKEIYSPEERIKLYVKSMESDDPYERLMGLLMSAAGDVNPDTGYPNVVYGFNPDEYTNEFWQTAGEAMSLFPKGVARTLGTSYDVQRVEDLSKKNGIDLAEAIKNLGTMSWSASDGVVVTPWTSSEDEFEKTKDEIRGKTWRELSDVQKVIVLEMGAAKENSNIRSVDRDIRFGNQRRLAKDLGNVSSDNDSVSREAINNVLIDSSYERVKQINSDLWKWQAWDQANIKGVEEQQFYDSLWASGNVGAGNFVGTIGRFAWENMVGKLLTGKSMNKISDAIAGSAESGTGILGWLAKHGISPTSKVGAGLLKFTANLVGTIPEDIVQTTVDNVLTHNAEENEHLFDIGQMSENFKNNLIFMAATNAVLAGISGIRRVKFMKDFAKKLDLDQEMDFDGGRAVTIMETADEAARAVARGDTIEVRDGKVYAIDSEGTPTLIENMTVEQAQILNERMNDIKENGFSEAQKRRATSSSDAADAVLNRKTVEEVTVKRDAEAARLESLEAKRKQWVENDYKDENGVDVRTREQTEYSNEEIKGTSQLEKLDKEIDTVRRNVDEYDQEIETLKKDTAPDSARAKFEEAAEKVKKSSDNVEVDDAAKAADGGTETTVKVDTDTADGRTETTVKDYSFKSDSVDDVLDTNIKIDATPSGVRRWHTRALNALLRGARANIQELHARFGDVRASDFDWIWYNTKIKNLSPDKIIGLVDPTTGRRVTQNMIDAAKWWGEQDFTKKLRMASRKALGIAGPEDSNVLGYLPHTSFDPATLTLEEAYQNGRGMLWKEATGKSVLNDNGEYVGYGGTLESRYRTFASNMLWDTKSNEILAAKLIEEAALEGKNLTPDEAMSLAKKVKSFSGDVDNAKSTKSLLKGAEKDGSDGMDDYKRAYKEIDEEAPKSGAGKATHDIWGEMVIGADTQDVVAQPKAATISLDTQGNTMRKIATADGNMYDNGGSALVYAPQDALIVVEGVQSSGAKWKDAISQFLQERSGRSKKYADLVADRIVARLASDIQKNGGKLTKGLAIQSLAKSFRSEAWSRYRRWLARAKFDKFSEGTKRFIDDFTFRHMQMDSYVNNQGLLTKLTNKIMELRYDALFYGNLKNALLQVSELSRLFTSFKLGDVTDMIKKMATDSDFRAEVDMYVRAVAPDTSYVDAALYNRYGQASEAMEIGEDGVRFKKFRDGKKAVDDLALAPINKAEAFKNRTMVAAIVQQADRLEAAGKIKNGTEKLMYIRQRFERVALAQNEMGRIGLSSNPVAKPFLFLQTFQLRELGMHLYNIFDPEDLDTAGGKIKSGAALEAAKYIMKVLGTKLGVTLILGRLGYDAAQTLGLDPLGISSNYNKLSEEEMTDIDKQLTNGFLTPFVSGGMMSLFADMYFTAREAYENANRETVADDAEARLNDNQNPFDRIDLGAVFNPGNLLGLATGFIPGSVAANRIGQMNQMMSSGWATSASGNKMYTAPDDLANTILGYLFGRSATQNAVNYNQTYGNDLGQTLSRTVGKFFANMGDNKYNSFDPIDSKNYTDWFDGSENDTQQFEKGRRYFNDKKKEIMKAYTDALNEGFGSNDENSEAKNDMNRKLNELFEDMARFVDAYENKHGTITGKMVKQLLNVLNTDFKDPNDTGEEEKESGYTESDKALERYNQLNLPAVGTYSGPTEKNPTAETKYQGSPQWRLKSGAKYDLQSEAAAVLRAGDAVLQDLRKSIKDIASRAYETGDYTEFNKAQREYLEAFDNVVGPIIAMYGNGVLSSKAVKDQLEEMLATSTNTGKVNLIPSEQYAKDKWGRYRSMPNESVDVGKWAQERYSSDIFKRPTVKSYSTAQEDIDNIQRLVSNGQTDMARALALELKVRIDNQKRSLSKTDYQWLLDFLNNGGQQ
jgi:hypothetical protein